MKGRKSIHSKKISLTIKVFRSSKEGLVSGVSDSTVTLVAKQAAYKE